MTDTAAGASDFIRLQVNRTILQNNLFPLIGEAADAPQHGAHAGEQLPHDERRRKMVVGAGVQGINAALSGVVVAGEEDDSQVRLHANVAAQFVGFHPRKPRMQN